MSPVLFVTFLVLRVHAVSSYTQYLQLTELTHKIFAESHSNTVVFFEVEDDFLRFFMKTRVNIPAIVWQHSPSAVAINTEWSWNAILVIPASRKNNFEGLEQLLPLLKVRKFVLVTGDEFEEIYQCMLYLRKNNFTRIFGIIGEKTYAYLPYENDPVRLLSKTEPLPNALKDLNGYTFRTIISPDLPRVFWYKDADGNRQIGGYVGQLFVNFLKRHNASFTEASIKDVESRFMLAVTEATKNKQIDVSMNAYKPVKGLQMSYPFALMRWGIIVPINGHIDANQYFVRPFFPTVWLSIGLTIIYIFSMNMLKDYLINEPLQNVWRNFSQIYLTMLNLPTEIPIKRHFRFHCQVIILAFILGNLYTVLLTSFLTVYIQIKQFDTIKDLVDKRFSVMMVNYEWKAIEDLDLHPKDFEKIVTLVEREVMFRERNTMVNTSFAYAMGADKAIFYMGFQKRFAAKSLFRMLHDTLGNYYLGFLLIEHSPFTEILNNFIVEILETGLLDKWLNDAVSQVRSNGLLKIGTVHPDRKVPYPLTVFHLSFAWICLTSGLIVATVVFVGEKITELLRGYKYK
ncbi:uncharacterized protein LOC129944857 [Eupeodes corollae]|uniref:uncharacterized protein LOC129944857 n=1 Tax=Eupeodes corollae TaxID=290404 RepID=UPI0024905C44|nr:uncharacterized protein LOC129944857 [Eupeodes corollae]